MGKGEFINLYYIAVFVAAPCFVTLGLTLTNSGTDIPFDERSADIIHSPVNNSCNLIFIPHNNFLKVGESTVLSEK